MIAGAGGIGRALARHLAERHGAMVWLIGRRPSSPDEAGMLTDLARGSVVHRVADLTDPVALGAAVAEAAGKSTQLDGVFHTALVMHDGLVGDLAERDFRAVVAPKAAGAINLLAALDGIDAGFVCAFSSSNAYTANRGQSAYAAASAFLDALVLARGGARARVIDWGLWGEAGRMADAASLASMRRFGVWPIGNDEGFAALSAVLAGRSRHVLALKLRDDLLSVLGVDAGQPNDQAVADLEAFIAASPPPADLDPSRFASVDDYARALLAETLARAPLPVPDGPAMTRLAAAARAAAEAAPATPAATLRETLLAAGPEAAPYVALLDRTVPALPDVVAGRVKATSLLFPDGSDRLVQAIYQGTVWSIGCSGWPPKRSSPRYVAAWRGIPRQRYGCSRSAPAPAPPRHSCSMRWRRSPGGWPSSSPTSGRASSSPPAAASKAGSGWRRSCSTPAAPVARKVYRTARSTWCWPPMSYMPRRAFRDARPYRPDAQAGWPAGVEGGDLDA